MANENANDSSMFTAAMVGAGLIAGGVGASRAYKYFTRTPVVANKKLVGEATKNFMKQNKKGSVTKGIGGFANGVKNYNTTDRIMENTTERVYKNFKESVNAFKNGIDQSQMQSYSANVSIYGNGKKLRKRISKANVKGNFDSARTIKY